MKKSILLIAISVLTSAIGIAQESQQKLEYRTGNPADWPDKLDAVVAAPKNHEILLENDRVRVLSVTLAPNEVENLHHHRWPSVLYVMQAEAFTDKDAQGNLIMDSRTLEEPLTFPLTMWKGPEAPHTATNLSNDKPIKLIRVELKEKHITDDLKMYSMVWDHIVNKGDMSYFSTTYFDENVTVLMQPDNIVGIESLKAYYQNFITGFSDREFTILNSFGQGDQIVKHWKFKGRHTGTFFGMPASGNTVDIEGTTIVKMKNGKIAQEQDFFDSSVMMQQLGMTSNPDNVDTINSLYDMFSKGNVPEVLALMDKNIVWNEAESNSLADGNPYIGPEAVLNGVFARIGERYKSFTLKDIKLHEMSNNQVLATLHYVLEMKNGKTYTIQAAHHWTLKDGKIVGFQQYADTKKLADSEKM